MQFAIRSARAEDAQRLVEMIHAFACDVAESTAIEPGAVERHVIRPDRVVDALLVEAAGRVVGYAMFHPSFLSFSGTRGLVLTDLFIDAGHRRRGLARALVAAVAKRCREQGGQWIQWEVWRKNEPALDFYGRVGARSRPGMVSMILEGDAFTRLAGRSGE